MVAHSQRPGVIAPLPPDTNAALASGGREPIGDWHPVPRSPLVAVSDSPVKMSRAWYGWQTLASDAVSYSLIGAGIGLAQASTSDGSYSALTFGLIGYAFAPPVIHLVHGRPGMVPASLAVRILVPAATLLIGSATDCQGGADADTGSCGGPGAAVGLIVGFALASAVDAGCFAWDKPQPEAVTAPQFGLAPSLSPDGKRAELHAFGTF